MEHKTLVKIHTHKQQFVSNKSCQQSTVYQSHRDVTFNHMNTKSWKLQTWTNKRRCIQTCRLILLCSGTDTVSVIVATDGEFCLSDLRGLPLFLAENKHFCFTSLFQMQPHPATMS